MQRHIPDELDIFIWKEIFDSHKLGEDSHTWAISKKYALITREKKTDRVYMKIKARIKEYIKFGFFFESANGNKQKIFNMNLDKISFMRRRCSDGIKKGVWICLPESN